MARDGLLFEELEMFADKLDSVGRKQMAKAEAKMMRKAGTKLKRRTLRQIRLANLRTITGNYKKSIQRGKVWKEDGSMRIRVYSNAPHAHLIEQGHIVYIKNGYKKVPGREVFIDAQNAFEPDFEDACEDLLDEVIREICK